MQQVSAPTGAPNGAKKTISPHVRSRLVLALLPLVILLLIGGGMYGLQAASSKGLELGYPTPQVQITSSVSGNISLSQPVTFTAQAGSQPDLTYTWDFGDGSSGSGVSVTHTYTNPGSGNNYTFTIQVTVKNVLGRTGTSSLAVTVLPAPPVAGFSYYETGYYCDNVTSTSIGVNFDASGSTIGTPNAQYSWDFGDSGSSSNTDSTNTPTDSHCYLGGAGPYTVTLTVTDDAGQSNTTKQLITIQ